MIKAKTISNLIKVFPFEEPCGEIFEAKILKNETFSYQISLFSDEDVTLFFGVESKLKNNIIVRKINYIKANKLGLLDNEDDYILKDKNNPCFFPDLLTPIKRELNLKKNEWFTIYVTIKNSKRVGNYPILINFIRDDKVVIKSKINIKILNIELDFNKILPNTNWFHFDGIANYYNLHVFSKKYCKYMVNFLKDQRKHGINMLCVPLFTPPLDTKIGTYRKTVQLVDIEVNDNCYKFNFDRVFKFLEFGKKLGFKYFEMSHLFSQWGAEKAPQIVAKVNGKLKRIFGWRDSSDGDKYLNFLREFLEELVIKLKENGYVKEEILFHLSDEPNGQAIEKYATFAVIFKKILHPYRIFDALSEYSFYEKGLVDEPVVVEDEIKEYRKNKINTFVYYCCCQAHDNIPNRFLNMPLNRMRVMGPLMYLDDAKGFLHWGYNFYNSELSIKKINPFEVPDADGRLPAGDPFIVYPGENGVPLNSIREETYLDSLQDYALLKMLEDKNGKEYVKSLLKEHNFISYNDYPHEDNACLYLHQILVDEITK